MKIAQGALVVVAAAGCASAPTAVGSKSVADADSFEAAAESFETLDPAPIAPRSDAAAAVAAMPVLQPGRWSGAGSDEGPEVRVTAPRETDSTLREDRLVGDNQQPEWTTERRWPTTRAYVLAPGQIEFEQWMKMHTPRGERPDKLWQTEVAFGLPSRFQVDLYENFGDDEEPSRPVRHEAVQFEVRYALADWGVLPFNPTLYEEWVVNPSSADRIESKLLLADDLGAGVHWAVNFFDEQTMGDARTTELGVAGGLSFAVVDSKFSVGAECKYERVTQDGSRGDPSNEFLIGPSIQWRPTENSHLDVAPLFGVTKSNRADPRLELWIVFGWDFGPERKEARAPTSSRSK